MTDRVVFPIGYVSITTGLSTHVLRAWERRYGAVSPNRSASGRRLYSQEDIDRLSRLSRAVRMGHSISQIAGLDDKALAGLTAPQVESLPAALPGGESVSTGTGTIPDIISACLRATEIFDDVGLRHIFQKASLTHNRQTIIESIIVPFMEQIGSRWRRGSMRIAHEHLASSVVAAYLNSQLVHLRGSRSSNRRILIAAPAGQFCYLGALAVAVTARDHGWHPVFLGSDLPSEEIAAAGLSLNPQMIALSITCQVDERFIERELNRLAGLLDGHCPFYIGGQSSGIFRDRIEKAGGTVCSSTRHLAEKL